MKNNKISQIAMLLALTFLGGCVGTGKQTTSSTNIPSSKKAVVTNDSESDPKTVLHDLGENLQEYADNYFPPAYKKDKSVYIDQTGAYVLSGVMLKSMVNTNGYDITPLIEDIQELPCSPDATSGLSCSYEAAAPVLIDSKVNHSPYNTTLNTSTYSETVTEATTTTLTNGWKLGTGLSYTRGWKLSVLPKGISELSRSITVNVAAEYNGSYATSNTQSDSWSISIPSSSLSVPGNTAIKVYAVLANIKISGSIPYLATVDTKHLNFNSMINAGGPIFLPSSGTVDMSRIFKDYGHLPYGMHFDDVTNEAVLDGDFKLNAVAGYHLYQVVCSENLKTHVSSCVNKYPSNQKIEVSKLELTSKLNKENQLKQSNSSSMVANGDNSDYGTIYNAPANGFTTGPNHDVMVVDADETSRAMGIYGYGLSFDNEGYMMLDLFTSYNYKTGKANFNGNRGSQRQSYRVIMDSGLITFMGGDLCNINGNQVQIGGSGMASGSGCTLSLFPSGEIAFIPKDDKYSARIIAGPHQYLVSYPTGSYIAACRNKSLNHGVFSAQCDSNERVTSLNYDGYCVAGTNVSSRNGVLTCDNWKHGVLPLGNYTDSCDYIIYMPSDSVNGYLNAMCKDSHGAWHKNQNIKATIDASCENQDGVLSCKE